MKRRSCASTGRALPGRLLLEGAERAELTLSLDDLLHRAGTESADQLVLEVGVADVEAQPFHLDARQVGAEAGPIEPAPEVVLLGGVAEPGQPTSSPGGPSCVRNLPIAGLRRSAGSRRPRRRDPGHGAAASASSADRSLAPSTSTTARAAASIGRGGSCSRTSRIFTARARCSQAEARVRHTPPRAAWEPPSPTHRAPARATRPGRSPPAGRAPS